MGRKDEFGRDIISDDDSVGDRSSHSPPRRRRRNSRSRSNSPPSFRQSRRRSRSRSRSAGARRGADRSMPSERFFERRPSFERKSYPPSPRSRPVDDYSTHSIPFPPSHPPPLAPPPLPPLPPLTGQRGKGRYQPHIKPPMDGIEPFKSYVEWKAALNQADDSSPEAYSAWQSSYVEKLKSVLVAEACSLEWFADRYNPIHLFRQNKESMKRMKTASESMHSMMMESLNQPLDNITSHPFVSAVSLSTFDEKGQLEQPPSFQGVPNVHNIKDRLVTIRKLPPWCTRADLLLTLEAAARGISREEMEGGVIDGEDCFIEKVYLSDTSKGRGKGYTSTAWIVYKDSTVAAGAAPSLGRTSSNSQSKPLEGMEVLGKPQDEELETQRHRLGAVELYRDRRPRFCPDMFAHPDRITYDLKAATALAASLDTKAELEEPNLDAILNSAALEEVVASVSQKAQEVRAELEAVSATTARASQEAADKSRQAAETSSLADKTLKEAQKELIRLKSAAAEAIEGDADTKSELNEGIERKEEEVLGFCQEAESAAVLATSAATAMLEATLAADNAQSEYIACYDGDTAAAALKLDVCIAWLRGVHLYAYYGGNKCRDEGDLLDSDDAIYVRPKYKVKKTKDEDDQNRRPRRKQQSNDEVLDIDVRLAMRCAALLEEGQHLEATADFIGANDKYQAMKSLGSHFQDKEMGAQVVEGAEEAISTLPTVPMPPSQQSAQANTMAAEREEREEEEVASWAKFESSSSLSFVKEMDSRVKEHTVNKDVGLDSSLKEQADKLESKLEEVKSAWVENSMQLVPSKTDPNAQSSKCAVCSKVFKEKTFAAKHLLSKHQEELDAELWPTLKECMMSAYSRDPAPPLPLLECSDGSSYPITVDPIDILKGKFVQPPAPTRQRNHRGDEARRSDEGGRSDGARYPAPSHGQKRANPDSTLNVAYVDMDAPKTEEVKVDYGSALGLAPLQKKKKRKKGAMSKADTETTA